ncbi:MAG: OmpA family protein [Spirochaetales bacterium]|nr:OmpA family protein [Spirochaetales bacterium]
MKQAVLYRTVELFKLDQKMIRLLSTLVFSLAPLSAQILLQSDPYFSPNSDGTRDTLWIEVDALPSDLKRSRDWRLEISSGGGIIRTIRADRRRKNISWIPFVKGRETIRTARRILWDGRNDSGQLVGDGYYDVWMKVDTLAGDTIVSEPLRVTASTRKPRIHLSSDQSIMKRVDAGGISEESGPILIAQSILEGSAYRFEGAFLNASGRVVEKRRWEGELPAAIEWNGRGFFGNAAHGVYRYRLTAEDAAGNRNSAYLNDIIITDQDLEIDLRSEKYFFSPEARSNIELEPVRVAGLTGRSAGSASSVPGDWSFQITRSVGGRAIFRQSGSTLPGRLIWNGLSEAGKPVSGGVYYAHLTKGESQSVYKPIYIDRKPPSVSIGVGWNDLSPDGDGWQDLQRISLGASDNYDLESWSLSIAVEPDETIQSPHRIFQGEGKPPSRFYWDGLGDNGEQLQSLERLTFVLEARDRAGNVRSSRLVRRSTAILFRPIKPGSPDLVSRIPDYRAFTPLDQLTGTGKRRLRAAKRQLSSYRSYFVRVESHAAMPGGEEENLLRSEFKASRAHAYFLQKGVSRKRIDFRGMGETEPLREDSNPFLDYRNSRIEVRLTLKREL